MSVWYFKRERERERGRQIDEKIVRSIEIKRKGHREIE